MWDSIERGKPKAGLPGQLVTYNISVLFAIASLFAEILGLFLEKENAFVDPHVSFHNAFIDADLANFHNSVANVAAPAKFAGFLAAERFISNAGLNRAHFMNPERKGDGERIIPKKPTQRGRIGRHRCVVK